MQLFIPILCMTDDYFLVSRMLPDNVASILSRPERRSNVLSLCDASDILRDAYARTEADMSHEYEVLSFLMKFIFMSC